jgi:uncharacterized beta-barrel protein YwiB (DUF1934 family)
MKKIMIIIIIILVAIVIKQHSEIETIKNTDYEFCFQGTCYTQKINDYLKNNE